MELKISAKPIFVFLGSIWGLLSPLHGLLMYSLILVFVDFVTGVWASQVNARNTGSSWGFESAKARRTVYKYIFIVVGILAFYGLETQVLTFVNMHLTNAFTGFVCSVEIWSILENGSKISNHKIFRLAQRFMKKKIDKALDTDIDELIKEDKEKGSPS